MIRTSRPSLPNSINSNKKHNSNERNSRMCSISLFKRGRIIVSYVTKQPIA